MLDEAPTPPSAEDLVAAAAEEERRYPECQEAHYRRQHPGWLEERPRSAYHGECRLQGIEVYLSGGRDLAPERREWLSHEELIRLLTEAARPNMRRAAAKAGSSRLLSAATPLIVEIKAAARGAEP